MNCSQKSAIWVGSTRDSFSLLHMVSSNMDQDGSFTFGKIHWLEAGSSPGLSIGGLCSSPHRLFHKVSWASSQHRSRVTKRSVPRGLGGSCKTSYEPHMSQHATFATLIKQVTKTTEMEAVDRIRSKDFGNIFNLSSSAESTATTSLKSILKLSSIHSFLEQSRQKTPKERNKKQTNQKNQNNNNKKTALGSAN